jgi:hypothetical protein
MRERKKRRRRIRPKVSVCVVVLLPVSKKEMGIHRLRRVSNSQVTLLLFFLAYTRLLAAIYVSVPAAAGLRGLTSKNKCMWRREKSHITGREILAFELVYSNFPVFGKTLFRSFFFFFVFLFLLFVSFLSHHSQLKE